MPVRCAIQYKWNIGIVYFVNCNLECCQNVSCQIVLRYPHQLEIEIGLALAIENIYIFPARKGSVLDGI